MILERYGLLTWKAKWPRARKREIELNFPFLVRSMCDHNCRDMAWLKLEALCCSSRWQVQKHLGHLVKLSGASPGAGVEWSSRNPVSLTQNVGVCSSWTCCNTALAPREIHFFLFKKIILCIWRAELQRKEMIEMEHYREETERASSWTCRLRAEAKIRVPSILCCFLGWTSKELDQNWNSPSEKPGLPAFL